MSNEKNVIFYKNVLTYHLHVHIHNGFHPHVNNIHLVKVLFMIKELLIDISWFTCIYHSTRYIMSSLSAKHWAVPNIINWATLDLILKKSMHILNVTCEIRSYYMYIFYVNYLSLFLVLQIPPWEHDLPETGWTVPEAFPVHP